MKFRRQIPKTLREGLVEQRGQFCERCGTNQYDHIHHKDHDPSNNFPSNLMLVCLRCHQEIHRNSDMYHSDVFGGRILTKPEVEYLARNPDIWPSIIGFNLETSGFLEVLKVDGS